MATTSVMRSADIAPPSHNFYPADNSPQTPPSANSSPTNLYSHLQVRQLRPPKQPLYTPACLRPTQSLSHPKNIPDRIRAPDTPPESQDSSFESASALAKYSSVTFSPVQSEAVLDATLLEEEEDVTGPPTAAHWKPDSSSSSCFICKTPFTWYFRRHHCRKCGHLVCASHFLRTVPLDQNARLHRRGTKSKACDSCYREWQTVKAWHSRSNSLAESQNSLQSPVPIPQHMKKNHGHHVGSMARSEGMVWSTF